MSALSREGLLSLGVPLTPAPVVLPGGAGTVHVRRMTAGHLAEFWAELDGLDGAHAKGVELSLILCDEAGTLLYTPADAAHLAALPAPIAVAITRAFREVNGLSDPKA